MIEHWERSVVTGTGPEVEATETVLHRRGDDVMQMAMRRNPQLAACSTISVRTAEAFTRIREDEKRRTPAEIPRDDRQGEEFEW